MQCRYCSEPPIFFRKISGEYLCKQHFIKSIEEKISKTVRKYQLFTPQDKVVVGVSGGKDSLALLYNIIKLQQRHPNPPTVEAILIDEGITGYRAESTALAQKICTGWNVPLHVVSFAKKFGSTLENLIPELKKQEINPCTICGTVRRRLLNEKALELKANKLAIGHNLDDVVETFMQNILRNDLGKILQNPPFGNPVDEENYFVPRVKPLISIPEAEIMRYCFYKEIPIQATPCPYVDQFFILRKQVQQFMNALEEHSAEVKYNVLNFNTRLIEQLARGEPLTKADQVSITKNPGSPGKAICSICGLPMGPSRKSCYYCELRKKFGLMP